MIKTSMVKNLIFSILALFSFNINSMESQEATNQLLGLNSFNEEPKHYVRSSSEFSYHHIASLPHSFNLHDFLKTPAGQKWSKNISCEKLKKTIEKLQKSPNGAKLPFANLNIGCEQASSAFHALFTSYWLIKAIFTKDQVAVCDVINNIHDFSKIAELFWDKDLNQNLRGIDAPGKWRQVVMDARKNKQLLSWYSTLPNNSKSKNEPENLKLEVAKKAFKVFQEVLQNNSDFEDEKNGLSLCTDELNEIIKSDNEIFLDNFKSNITVVELDSDPENIEKQSQVISKILQDFNKNKNKIHAFIINDDIDRSWYSVVINKANNRVQCMFIDSSDELKLDRTFVKNILQEIQQHSVADLFKTEIPRNQFEDFYPETHYTKSNGTFKNINNKHDETSIAKIELIEPLTLKDFVGELPDEVIGIINTLNDPRFRTKNEKNTLMLYGPSGNGKTTIARVIAGETSRVLLGVNGSALLNSYQGSGPKSVQKLFDKAKSFGKPCIIFIDEADGIGFKRSKERTDEREAGLRMLLTTIDEFTYDESIFIIAATNMEEVLDESLLSRFQGNVEVELPNAEARFKLLKYLFNQDEKYEKKFTDKDLKEITDEGRIRSSTTHGFSVRDLEILVENTYGCAKTQKRFFITREDIYKSIKKLQKKIYNGKKLQKDKEFREMEQRAALYLNTITNVGSVGYGAFKEFNAYRKGSNQK